MVVMVDTTPARWLSSGIPDLP